MAPPQAQEARMIGRGQEARMQEVISWSWKQFCPSPRAARRPHPFLIRVIIIKCNLPPAHFQNPPSFPTSPSDWRKANQKKREFLFKVQKTAKCKGQQTKGKAGEMESIIKLHKNSYNLWNSSLNNPEIRKLLKGRNQPSANLLLSNGKPACFFSPGMASFDMKRFEKFTLWGLLKRGPVPWGEGGASHCCLLLSGGGEIVEWNWLLQPSFVWILFRLTCIWPLQEGRWWQLFYHNCHIAIMPLLLWLTICNDEWCSKG